MKILTTIIGILILLVFLIGIPIIVQMIACEHCNRRNECEARMNQGQNPPCKDGMSCHFHHQNI